MNNQYKKYQQMMAARKKALNASVPGPQRVTPLRVPTRNTINTGGPDYPTQVKQEELINSQINEVDRRIANADKNYNYYNNLCKQAAAMVDSGKVTTKTPIDLINNMKGTEGNPLMPGNIGDINRVYWPFWYTASAPKLAPDEASIGEFTVTQEAGFIITAYAKSVFIEDNVTANNFSYIDPGQPDGGAKSDGLFFTFKDAQSSRIFHSQPMDINQVGYWRKPTALPTPMLLLPNSIFQVEYTNNDPNNTYKPFMTFYGVRIRLDQARELLGTVSNKY